MSDSKTYSRREEHLFETDWILSSTHRLPAHVRYWIGDNYDELWDVFTRLESYTDHIPWIMDRMNFAAFCACAARLSSIDSPHTAMGRMGGRNRVYDFLSESASARADAEAASSSGSSAS